MNWALGKTDLEEETASNIPAALWQEYFDRQLRALDQVDAILATDHEQTPSEADVTRAQDLVALTAIEQPGADLPQELAQQASQVHNRMLATQGRLDAARKSMADQLDRLRTGAMTQDRGPIFLDTSG